MAFDNDLVAGKLRRWEGYLENFRLPKWEEIPDIGLYMEQVTALLKDYLDYLPPELKEEQFITPATINNYVRTKVMPEPIKKRYYRIHLAYLIMILTLKQNLSLALVQKLVPNGMTQEEMKERYTTYARRHAIASKYFIREIRKAAGPILQHEDTSDISSTKTEDLISTCVVAGSFAKLLAEKLLLLQDKDLESGGSIEIVWKNSQDDES